MCIRDRSVSVIRSFLLQDIPRHPDIRLFEVREAFKRSLLRGFQAHIRAYIAFFSPPAALRGPSRGNRQTPNHYLMPWGYFGHFTLLFMQKLCVQKQATYVIYGHRTRSLGKTTYRDFNETDVTYGHRNRSPRREANERSQWNKRNLRAS